MALGRDPSSRPHRSGWSKISVAIVQYLKNRTPDIRQTIIHFAKIDGIQAVECLGLCNFQLCGDGRQYRLLSIQAHDDDFNGVKQNFVRNIQLVWSRHSHPLPLLRFALQYVAEDGRYVTEKPYNTLTAITSNLIAIIIGWRIWLAIGLTVTISLTLALTFAGILTVALGLPLAWRIDRASYSWAEQTEAVPEGGGW
jgi:hypothetical protein